MTTPNEPFIIHIGEFILKGVKRDDLIKVRGSISYKWVPNRKVILEGVILDTSYWQDLSENTYDVF